MLLDLNHAPKAHDQPAGKLHDGAVILLNLVLEYSTSSMTSYIMIEIITYPPRAVPLYRYSYMYRTSSSRYGRT
jgi:hypothetical protein